MPYMSTIEGDMLTIIEFIRQGNQKFLTQIAQVPAADAMAVPEITAERDKMRMQIIIMRNALEGIATQADYKRTYPDGDFTWKMVYDIASGALDKAKAQGREE